MTDFIVRKTSRGKYGIFSSFNDACLYKREDREDAIQIAREMAWRENNGDSEVTDSKAIVHYEAKKPEQYE